MQNTFKVLRKDLQNILGVSEKTARKEYQTILDSLGLKRKYLTYKDLENYGL